MDNELFDKAPVPKAYFTLALPVVLSMLVSMVYNMVDTFFIAHTGNTDMVAGVSLAAPVITVMIALGDIFGLGGSSVISRLFGKHRYDDGRRLSACCFWGAVIVGAVVIVLGLVFHDPILALLGADERTWAYASPFYMIIIAGSPLIVLSLTPNNLLRCEGFAVPSMIGAAGGTIVNIILNPIFIQILGWGAAGSAAATVIAYCVQDLYYIWFLARRSRNLSLDPRLIRLSAREAGEILVIGIPASLTNIMQSIGLVMVNLFLLAYGTDAVAAMGIVLKIMMIAVLVLVGFAFGAQPLIGYNYGAGNFKRLGHVMRFSYAFLCSYAIVATIALSLLARPLMGFFIDDPTVIAEGTGMLRVQLLSVVCVAIVMVTTCMFQSTGKAIGALTLSVCRQGVVLAVTLWVGSRLFGYQGVIAAQAVADLITAIIAVALFAILLPELRPGRGSAAGNKNAVSI